MHGLEDQYGEQVNFVYLDIDDAQTEPFKKALGYRYQPHIFLLDSDGNVLNQWIGLANGSDIEAAILSALE